MFANDQIYHIFNRGVERRNVFTVQREFERALDTLFFYRFSDLPMSYSKFLALSLEERNNFLKTLENSTKVVDIMSYCLIPNHFHLVLKQKEDNGVRSFVANFTNSYSKYFNFRHKRIGPLFQGIFKAVRVETDEQLLHLSRYVHLNPVTSYLVKPEKIEEYQWSSFNEYLNKAKKNICDTSFILSNFKSREKYKEFVYDQISYQKDIQKIEFLCLDKDK